jgi:hypothetical protein
MSLEFHPLANLFPLIDGAEFDDLVATNARAAGADCHIREQDP